MRSYTLLEEAGWLWRNIVPPAKRTSDIAFIPSGSVLNRITPSLSFAALGDCMDMRGKELNFGRGLKSFIAGHNLLLANWEGTLTGNSRVIFRQRHDRKTIESFSSLFPPSKTVLSVANNHAADYSYDIFSQSVRRLEEYGFSVIGTREHPFIDPSPDIRIIAASAWSNRPCSFITELDDAALYIRKGCFNILFVHWGHEMELFPRRERTEEMHCLLRRYDAVIGHHPHLPQPVTEVKELSTGKVAAFSLGNFFSGISRERYRHGIALSVEIGRMEDMMPAAGEIRMMFTRSFPASSDRIEVEGIPFSPWFNSSEL